MGKREDEVLAARAGEEHTPLGQSPDTATASAAGAALPQPLTIGGVLRQLRGLSEQQVEQVLALQRDQVHLRFGEAAVALRLATQQDVLWALSQQHAHAWVRGDAAELGAELVMARDPFSRQAEQMRVLRSRLLSDVLSPQGEHRALAVTSAEAGVGKTYFAANMAIALSQLGARTLLVDANLRTPRVHALFGLGNGAGLGGVLARRQHALACIHKVEALPNLFVMPAGTLAPNPADLVQRGTLDTLLQETSQAFDHVIVDTPAASLGADAPVIAAKAGAALVVARRHASRMAPLQALLGELSRRPLRVAGVVLNER